MLSSLLNIRSKTTKKISKYLMPHLGRRTTWLPIPRAGHLSSCESLLSRNGVTGASRQQPLETGREKQHVPCLFLEMHLQEESPKCFQGLWSYFLGYLKNLPVCRLSTSVLDACGNCPVPRRLLGFPSSQSCCIVVRYFTRLSEG